MIQTVHLECHQQRSFTLKMHQNRWRLGLGPRPHWGSLQHSPDCLTGLRRPSSTGREGKGRRGTLDPHNVGDRLTPVIKDGILVFIIPRFNKWCSSDRCRVIYSAPWRILHGGGRLTTYFSPAINKFPAPLFFSLLPPWKILISARDEIDTVKITPPYVVIHDQPTISAVLSDMLVLYYH